MIAVVRISKTFCGRFAITVSILDRIERRVEGGFPRRTR